MRIVMDTNVLVSAMLTAGGPPDMIVQLVLAGELSLVLDSRILREYDEVTVRDRFAFDPGERRVLIDALAALAEPVVAVPLKLSLPDPEDRMFVEVARAGHAEAIVTGNVRHFKPKAGVLRVPVLTPRQLVDRVRR